MKTVKYVSKNQRLTLVLKHGVPAEPITGRHAIPGIYLRFEEGFLEVNENIARKFNKEFDELIQMVEGHSAFGESFIRIEESDVDPYKNMRKDTEPAHDIIQIGAGGSIGKNLNPQNPLKLTSEQNKAIINIAADMAKTMAAEMAKTMAVEMAKAMAPNMAKKLLKNLAKGEKENKKGKEDKIDEDKDDKIVNIENEIKTELINN